MAYVAHYNSPLFYRQLDNVTPARFKLLVCRAFGILIPMYAAAMAAGYATFGDTCQGNILVNYHPDDVLANAGRLATWVSILFGFPLVAAGAREGAIGVASHFGYASVGSDNNHVRLVSAILVSVTAVACAVDDLSLEVGVIGATMGSFVVYICPPLVYVKAVALAHGFDSIEYSKARRNLFLVPFGIAISILGLVVVISSAQTHPSTK
jgi:amino acid permease